jgi:hypothetical protein
MDRDRAAEIQKHLLEASDALDRVTEAMFKLMAISYEMLGARIVALAKAGRIEGAGDLRMWRHSEVRLRP